MSFTCGHTLHKMLTELAAYLDGFVSREAYDAVVKERDDLRLYAAQCSLNADNANISLGCACEELKENRLRSQLAEDDAMSRAQGWSMELRCADALWAPLAWYRDKDDAYRAVRKYRVNFPASSLRLVSAPCPLTFRD